jgi:ketosteroid isomerase-like protein
MTRTDPKTKTRMTVKGKYLTVYTKQTDGSWKAVAHAFNSDSPVT